MGLHTTLRVAHSSRNKYRTFELRLAARHNFQLMLRHMRNRMPRAVIVENVAGLSQR